MQDSLITLQNLSEQGDLLQAVFAPLQGMNLVSFIKKDLEILDQTTKPLFMERSAGLGALIGPHFHHRPSEQIPYLPETFLFPHLEKQRAQGIVEPFSHGIARYVPWQYSYSDTQIHATLSGKDTYKGHFIKDLEGQDFTMNLVIKLVHDGLLLQLSIASEQPSVVGFHYYYTCPIEGLIQAHVQPNYRTNQGWDDIPQKWYDSEKHKLHLPLSQEVDVGFLPFTTEEDPYHLVCLKDLSSSHVLHVEYTSSYEQETSWQLYHPSAASFVCIEPLSATNPRKPILSTSNLQIKISFF